jgi:phosphomannomutase
MDQETLERIQFWLNSSIDPELKEPVIRWQQEDTQALEDAFNRELEFGTGGMRGIMAPGTSHINSFTIAKATYGLAEYYKKKYPGRQLKAVISFDNRHHSQEFAQLAAAVLTQSNIHVTLTAQLRPTPFLSFLVLLEQAQFGIMISASHNPKEYNGYKVYFATGGQVVHPDDERIEATIRSLPHRSVPVNPSLDPRYLTLTTQDHDRAYLKALQQLALNLKQSLQSGSLLKILYTNLHGTGLTLLPQALSQLGFTNFHVVIEQAPYDGDFPYAPSPNPEDRQALERGLKRLEQEDFDLFIATDPDADRLAAAIRHQGKGVVLTGNEMAVLCLEYLFRQQRKRVQPVVKPVVISTIVSSRLIKKIAEEHGAEYRDVLTGFKYIGEIMSGLEHRQQLDRFLFGAEESYGFLYGTYAKDKDGIAASCLLAEMTLDFKLQQLTLVDALHQIYRQYGVVQEKTATISLASGALGQAQKTRLMSYLFDTRHETLLGQRVVRLRNYRDQQSLDLSTGSISSIDLPSSQVLAFDFEDGSELLIRPSGTEPKIKIYANDIIHSFLEVDAAIKQSQETLSQRISDVKQWLLSLI